METNFEDMVFQSDEEMEKEFDKLLAVLKDGLEADNQRNVANLRQIKAMRFVKAAMEYMMSDYIAKVYSETIGTMGTVTVECKSLKFDDPAWFAGVAQLADNVEVYPLKKDAVRMSFAFHGVNI